MPTTKKSTSFIASHSKFSNNAHPINPKMFTTDMARKFTANLAKYTKQSMYKRQHKLHQKYGNK